MAQANLTVSDALTRAFAAAAADASCRCVEVEVDMQALELRPGAVTACIGSQQEDYASCVAGSWNDSNCSLFLFRVSEEKFTSILFAPDTAPVRAKMLFASTVQQARKAFGTDRLESGFHAADEEEASAESFAQWLVRAHSSVAALSDTERIRDAIAEQAARATTEASASASSGSSGGLVSFRSSDALVPALRSFAAGETAALAIRLDAGDEVLNVLGTVTEAAAKVASAAAVLDLVSTDAPGFLLLSRDAFAAIALASGADDGAIPEPTKGTPLGCALVYICPPGAHVREKMLQSTAKATVLEVSRTGAGIEFGELMEVEDAKELSEDAARTITAERAAESAASTVALATGASASAAAGFDKPSRPGRRRRKLE